MKRLIMVLKCWFLPVIEWKTLLEKEKIVATSIFSFSKDFFSGLWKMKGLYGKMIKPWPEHGPWLLLLLLFFLEFSQQFWVLWCCRRGLLGTLLLSLSQTTNFRRFLTERVCRRQFQAYWKWQKALQTGIKHCGKRRNCSWRAISPFPSVFSKDLYCRHVKTRACLGKG